MADYIKNRLKPVEFKRKFLVKNSKTMQLTEEEESALRVDSVVRPRTVGRWVVIALPKMKLRVISVRGTSNVQDAFADLKLYSSVAVLQFMAILTPVLSLMPVSVTRRLVNSHLTNTLFGNKAIWDRLQHAAARHKKEARDKGEILLMTGHSLGGALVGAVSSVIKVDGIGFSPPGLYYQVLKYSGTLQGLYDSFTVIQPSNDVVPRVDKQRGMIEWIDCDTPPATCHRLTHTACELWVKCGDARKRSWRQTCSECEADGEDVPAIAAYTDPIARLADEIERRMKKNAVFGGMFTDDEA
eukprot:g4463.t1